MMFVLTLLSVLSAGSALTRILRLETSSRVGDLGFAWLIGSGYLGLALASLRFIAGLRSSAVGTVMVVVAPVIASLLLRGRQAESSARSAVTARALASARWLVPLFAMYTVIATGMIAAHAINTPTHTDDALRLRALAPFLAFDDSWGPAARSVFLATGPISTFVPFLVSPLRGPDSFCVNYVSVANLIALLLIVIAIPTARGAFVRAWVSAFAVLSLPLFMYHCTSTYADAWLAIYVGAAVFFLIEQSETADPKDSGRALLLLVAASMIKREGELVAAPVALVVLLASFVRFRRLRPALYLAPYALFAATKIAAVGWGSAFPFATTLLARATAEVAAAGGPSTVLTPPAPSIDQAPRIFIFALFESGNAGLLFFLLGPAVLTSLARIRRRSVDYAVVAIIALFFEAALVALWLYPSFTVDQSTVHRALLPVSVAGALWLAAFCCRWHETG